MLAQQQQLLQQHQQTAQALRITDPMAASQLLQLQMLQHLDPARAAMLAAASQQPPVTSAAATSAAAVQAGHLDLLRAHMEQQQLLAQAQAQAGGQQEREALVRQMMAQQQAVQQQQQQQAQQNANQQRGQQMDAALLAAQRLPAAMPGLPAGLPLLECSQYSGCFSQCPPDDSSHQCDADLHHDAGQPTLPTRTYGPPPAHDAQADAVCQPAPAAAIEGV